MTDTKPSARHWLVALAIVAELSYLVYFFSLDLPNSGSPGARVSRRDVLRVAIGWSNLPVPAAEALKQIVQVDWMPHRARTLLLAMLVVGASVALGYLLLCLAGFARDVNDGDHAAQATPADAPYTDAALTRAERLVFAYGLGTSALSLATLGLGLAGWTNRTAVLVGLAALCCYVIVWEIWRRVRANRAAGAVAARNGNSIGFFRWSHLGGTAPVGQVLAAIAIALFLMISLLGALLPATDFDVREYHLQVPKEFFQAGRIQFLPHNVYGNMPFGTEMLHLLGMIVAGDWWWGALVGQVVLAGFAPMTAIGIWSFGRRIFGSKAGWFAALIYLTTPWVYRISIIPYTENALSFFLIAGTLAMICACDQVHSARQVRLWCVAGALAGSAAACKYPALISTVLPLGMAAACFPIARRLLRGQHGSGRVGFLPSLLAFAAGVALTFGPWLAKNWTTTGNPVYPLLYRVFGGRNWTPEKNDKWEWGHRVSLLVALGLQRPPIGQSYHRDDPQISLSLRRLMENIVDVTAQADWQSPIVFGFAPLAFLRSGRRRVALLLWLFVVFLFFEWWLLTHRLDRFWIPLLPIASVLAGAGVVWNDGAIWKRAARLVLAICIFFDFSFSTTPLCGDNRYATRLDERRDPIDFTVNWLNHNLPADSKVLAVGAADLFHLDRPVVYNTVFDDCIFEQWVREPDQAADNLRRHRISHILVNWQEIERYRQRGSYGYTEFVQPDVFRELVQAGILRPLITFGVAAAQDGENREKTAASELFVVTTQSI